MSARFVVLGGYGAVGAAVALRLGEWFPGEVLATGRDPEQLDALARRSGGAVTVRPLDVRDREVVVSTVAGAEVAMMCVERDNVTVAEACLAAGVHYVDVVATAPVVTAIEQLDPLARSAAATAVLSVGLAPGLTNVAARWVYERQPDATRIDLSLVFGLAGDHGSDSTRWIVARLADPAPAGVKPARVTVLGVGERVVHPLGFSDQTTLARRLGLPVTTRIAFESAGATEALFALRRAGVFQLVRGRGGALLRRAVRPVRFGTDRFVIQADAVGPRASTTLAVAGHGESRSTGIVAAHVARRLVEGGAPTGVAHLDDLVATDELLRSLERDGLHTRTRVGAPTDRVDSPG